MNKKSWATIFLILIVIILLTVFFFIKSGYGPPFKEDQSEFSDLDIKRAVYSDYKIPPWFLEEKSNKIEIVYFNQNKDYFCSDNLNLNKTIQENEKYFSYVENETEYRTIKCSFINYLNEIYYREGFLFSPYDTNTTLFIGNYSKKPQTKEEVKDLIEFLSFEKYELNTNKILSSFTQDMGEVFRHTIFQTRLIEGRSEFCDDIFLIKVIYEIEKNTGKIYHKETKTVKRVKGKC